MIWIKTTPVSADPHLQQCIDDSLQLYPPEYRQPVTNVGNEQGASIVMAHSLIPEALKHAFSHFGALMSPDLPLSRRQHELIASTVSTLNNCFY